MNTKIKNILGKTVLVVCIALLAAMSIKGNGLKFEKEYTQDLGGPYEASNSRGRYMLVQAIADSGTFFLTRDQAAFSLPDLAIVDGKYISIFTPGVTFLGLPFYLVGKLIGMPQITTFLLNFFLSLLNVFLVSHLAQKLGASKLSATICGFLFLFGTNSLSYASTFTQHTLSATLILLGLINAIEKRSLHNNIALGYWFGLSLTVDIPNLLIYLPVLAFVASRHFVFKKIASSLQVKYDLKLLAILIGAIPFIVAFAWYNHRLTGSYTALPQFLGRITTLEPKQEPTLSPSSAPFEPGHFALNSRNLIRGVYTLVISSERSWIYYSPFLVIGLIGLIVSSKDEKTRKLGLLCLAAGTTNLLTYMLFGDPWGGWAFGPRYLIPGAAIFAAGFGPMLDKAIKKWYWSIPVFIICLYSIAINLSGGITTNLVPPKVEAVAMQEPIPYNYKYNFQLLFAKNQSGSIFYNTSVSKKISAGQFYLLYLAAVSVMFVIMFSSLVTVSKNKHV